MHCSGYMKFNPCFLYRPVNTIMYSISGKRQQTGVRLEGEDGGVLVRTEHINQCLRHEQSDSDANGD